MIKISQIKMEEQQDFIKQEEYAHKDSFEYIPTARGFTYLDLSQGNPSILLIIQITGGADSEDALIEKNDWRRYTAQIWRVFNNSNINAIKESTLLSVSSMMFSRNKNDGLACRVLLSEKGLIADDALYILKKNIKEELEKSNLAQNIDMKEDFSLDNETPAASDENIYNKEETHTASTASDDETTSSSANTQNEEDTPDTAASDIETDNDNTKDDTPNMSMNDMSTNDSTPKKDKSLFRTTNDINYYNNIELKKIEKCSDPFVQANKSLFLYEQDPEYELHEDDFNTPTTSSKLKLRQIYQAVITYYLTNERNYTKRAIKQEIEEDVFIENVTAHINKYYRVPVEDISFLINKIKKSFFSYGALIPAINDPDVTDIRVDAYNKIIVKVKGKHYVASGLSFMDDIEYNAFITNIIIRNKIGIDFAYLLFSDTHFCDDYILRFNICLPEVNMSGVPTLHIRKEPKEKTSLIDLINKGMLDGQTASLLIDRAKNSKGLVISGPSASGKSLLMNALVDYIPKKDAIFVEQESDEIFTRIHPSAFIQHIVKDTKGHIKIGYSEMGQNALVCDSQYIITGEVKGAEARDMLRACNTGHKCWCTVHSESCRDTILRLADYVKMGADYSLEDAMRMLKALETIVYVENFKIQEIVQIDFYDEDKKELVYKNVYNLADKTPTS